MWRERISIGSVGEALIESEDADLHEQRLHCECRLMEAARRVDSLKGGVEIRGDARSLSIARLPPSRVSVERHWEARVAKLARVGGPVDSARSGLYCAL